MVRSMMSYSTLPNSFWGYALQTTADILNVVPSKAIQMTPMELWCGRKPSLRHYRVWGYPAHVLSRRKIRKLDSRTEVCMVIGYPKGTRGGIFYNPRDKKVLVSTHPTFFEHEYINYFKPRSKVLLEDSMERKSRNDTTRVVDKDTDSMTTRVVDIDNKTENITDLSNQKVIMPRHSGRIRRAPDRYEANIIVPDTNDEDPSSYEEAMMDSDKEKQHEAMNQEMESMYSNSIWELIDLHERFRPTGNKQIYQRKRGPDGKVETYKARLVAKSYTQKEGVDYEETFSPVAMLKSIRILLFMVASLDYQICQIDVQTAFLNGNLDGKIYMS